MFYALPGAIFVAFYGSPPQYLISFIRREEEEAVAAEEAAAAAAEAEIEAREKELARLREESERRQKEEDDRRRKESEVRTATWGPRLNRISGFKKRQKEHRAKLVRTEKSINARRIVTQKKSLLSKPKDWDQNYERLVRLSLGE